MSEDIHATDSKAAPAFPEGQIMPTQGQKRRFSRREVLAGGVAGSAGLLAVGPGGLAASLMGRLTRSLY